MEKPCRHGCGNPRRVISNKDGKIQRGTECQHCRHYRYTYGITLVDIVRMLEEQGNLCKICNGPVKLRDLKSGQRSHNQETLCVDHCHTTNVIRGILCNECNKGLGAFKDNINSLNNAINYLESFK